MTAHFTFSFLRRVLLTPYFHLLPHSLHFPSLLSSRRPSIQIYWSIYSVQLPPAPPLLAFFCVGLLGHLFNFVSNKPIFSIVVILSSFYSFLFFLLSAHVLILGRACGGASAICALIGIGVCEWSFEQGEKRPKRRRSCRLIAIWWTRAFPQVLAGSVGSNLLLACSRWAELMLTGFPWNA